VGPRHRPRGHRDAGGRRAQALRGGEEDPQRPRASRVPRARVGVEGEARELHPRAVPPHGFLVRLVAHEVHDGARAVARRARGVRAPLREGPRLPRPEDRQLGLRARDGRRRRRDRVRRAQGQALPHPLPGRREARRARRRRHDAAGDDARRHGRRRPPRGRALEAPRRQEPRAPADRPRDPGRRRRRRRARVRDGSREGHARARSGRLRARPAARAPDRQSVREERAAQRERRRVPRPVAREGARRGREEARGGGPAREGRALRAQRRDLGPQQERRRADRQRAVVRQDEAARRPRDPRGEDRSVALPPRALDEGLPRLARERARLVHQPPALVGAPDPRVVRRGRRARRLARGPRDREQAPEDREADRPTGPRRARHVGELVAVARSRRSAGPI
jgi:hypothetical protein